MRLNFKKLMVSSLLLVLLVSLSFFILSFILNKIRRAKELVGYKEMELKELSSLYMKYKNVLFYNKKMSDLISIKDADFELLSYLEDISERVGVKEKISTMKPSETGPDEKGALLTLKNIKMEELVDYLYELINSGKMLLIKRMIIRAVDIKQQKFLETTLVVTSLKYP